MNRAAFINFLLHLLFLLVIMQFVGGILYMLKADQCRDLFNSKYIVPISIHPDIIHAITLTLDILFALIFGCGCIGTSLGIFGFIAAICVKINPLYTFPVAVAFMCYVISNAVIDRCFHYINHTLLLVIEDELYDIFNSINVLDGMFWLYRDRYMVGDKFIYEEGWSTATKSNFSHNLEHVDFIQITQKCCGLNGRSFWEIPVPQTCCETSNCTLMYAYDDGCLNEYNIFSMCMSDLRLQNLVMMFHAFGIGVLGLYLTYFEVKYSDMNYESEPEYKTSDEEL